MRAVILAGGRGTRLWPYTVAIPKPLVPIGDLPILEIVVRQLARAGFARVTLAVNHQADIIRAYCGDGGKWGVNIDYSLETTALGTMGPLKLVRDLPDNFLVMNGDILSDIDYGAMLTSHKAQDALFSIAAAPREHRVDYGVLEVDGTDALTSFREKPETAFLVSMGVYCVNRRTLDWIPEAKPFGFDQLMLDLIGARQRVAVRRHNGYWLDVGRPDDYQRAVDEWPALAPRILPEL